MSQPERVTGNSAAAATGRVIASLTAQAAQVAQDLDALLAPIGQHRDRLRETLIGSGAIRQVPPHDPGIPITAVDGAFVAQPLYACDLITALAAAAPGIHTPDTSINYPYETYACALPRGISRDAISKLLMFSLELGVNAQLPADLPGIIAVDGALATPVIGVLTSLSQTRGTVPQKILTHVEPHILAGIAAISEPTRTTIGLPKADTSSDWAHHWSELIGFPLPPTDRLIATQLLEPGEYLEPRTATGGMNLGKNRPDTTSGELIAAVEQATGLFRELARQGAHKSTYFKPTTCHDTVIKIEYLHGHGNYTIADIVAAVNADTPGPHLQEPFSQYLVDVTVKTVSVGSEALRGNLLNQLPKNAPYMNQIIKGYRTGNANRK